MAALPPRITSFVTEDNYRHFVRLWPVGVPRARVVCLHGIISHGGWYFHSAQRLADSGFEVHFLERRGSGLSRRQLGDVDAFETWIRDVTSYLERLPTSPPRLLLGISWGGKIAAAVARQAPTLVDGLGLLCPGLFARRGAGRRQKMLLRLASLLSLQRLRVPVPLQQSELFTDVPAWQQYIDRDPLTLRTVTVRLALENLRLDAALEGIAPLIDRPTLLMLAGRDRIIDNERVEQFFARLGSRRKRLIKYPEAAHTLEFEPAPEPFIEDLMAWIESVLPTVESAAEPHGT